MAYWDTPLTRRTVASLPDCDTHPDLRPAEDIPAADYDAPTTVGGGSWAYMCRDCMDVVGIHTPTATRLVQRDPDPDTPPVAFDHWMSRVNQILRQCVGLTSGDLADQTWADWHQAGLTPKQAAKACLQNEHAPHHIIDMIEA